MADETTGPDANDPRHVAYQTATREYFARYAAIYGDHPEPYTYADFMTNLDGWRLNDDLASTPQDVPHMWWRRDACLSLSDVYEEEAGLNRPWDADGTAWYHYLQVYHGWTKEDIREAHRSSDEWEDEHGSPPPEGGIVSVPKVHRSDFLTLRLLNGEVVSKNIDARGRYQQRDDQGRQDIRDAIKGRGYTRIWLDVIKDDADEFATPETLVPYLKECHEVGIGVCLLIAPEDAPKMREKYLATGRYNGALESALKVWKPYVTEVCIGVEASESWKDPDDILSVAKTVRKVIVKPKILSLHLNQAKLRPMNAGSEFWPKAKAAGITMFDYQVKHPAVEDGGGAFLGDPSTIKNELKAALAEVGDGIGVRCHEYAYFGKNPSKAIVAKVSKDGAILGEKALEVVGVRGICNGGPGYFPPTEASPVPPGTEDEITVQSVRFFTRTGADISSEIRRWPIDSALTPKYSGGDLAFAHTQSRSWPTTAESDVNANCWIAFQQGGQWKCYTVDYLRAGNPKKEWDKINQVNEPPTGWEAKKGEIVYLLVSRIARTGTYPNGKSRTQLVKFVCP